MKFLFVLLFISLGKIESQGSYRRLHLTIDNFKHVTKRYPTHFCCWEERDIEVCSSCGMRYSVTTDRSTEELGRDSSLKEIFEIKKDHVLSTLTGQKCMNISITSLESSTRKLMDLWRISCLDLPVGNNYTVTDEFGVFKNMKITFDAWWECVGFSGPNCVKECNPNIRSFCDSNGDLRCIDGFVDPPNCRLDSPCVNSPCQNGAECLALSTTDYKCECTSLFTGKNCDKSRCEPSKCAGRCENGECICTSDKVDVSCTSISCEGNFLCKNNGTCGTLKGETFCICPPHTSGAYCQFHCEPNCVNGRCQADSRGNSVCQCFPNFIGPTCEKGLIEDVKPPSTKTGFPVEAIIILPFAVIFGLLSIILITKIIYDRYGKKVSITRRNINSGTSFDG